MKRARISDATASPEGCRVEVEVEPADGAELDAERIASQLEAFTRNERRPCAITVSGRLVCLEYPRARRDVAVHLALDAVLLSGLYAADPLTPAEPEPPEPEPAPVQLDELDLLKSPLVTCEAITLAMFDRSESLAIERNAIERAALEAQPFHAPHWYPETIRFMRAVLRAGGKRLVGPRSKFRALAGDLQRRGMLRLEHYSSRHGSLYSATARGRAEFTDSHQVGTHAG